MQKVYLNGSLRDKESVKISPFDRGFLFGDAVYEVIPVYQQRPFAVDFHYQRLLRNLELIDIKAPFTFDRFISLLHSLINQPCRPDNFAVYLQVSRGDSGSRSHVISKAMNPTVFAFLQPRELISKDTYRLGCKAILQEDIRWRKSHIKTTSLLANVLHLSQAKKQNASEVLLHDNGVFTEGASSNVFFSISGQLVTPLLSEKIIPGTTRYRVIEVAKKLGIVVKEQLCSLNILNEVDEIILTGGTKELMPIVLLDDKVIGVGKPGPVWHKLFDAYQELFHDCVN